MPGTKLHINPNGMNGATLERVRLNVLSAEARPGAMPPAVNETQGTLPRLTISGTHAGCVERRDEAALRWVGVPSGACEYDGRLSLTHFRGRYWLFARSNLATTGQRFVQAMSSSDLRTWSPFHLLSVEGYAPAHGDIYFFAVQANPVDAESMVAIFPLVHRGRACICISFSRDALSWSRPRPLLRCAAAGERSIHQPAMGFLKRGESVLLYVHENVPSIREDARTPEVQKVRLHRLMARSKCCEPRIVRYAIPVATLVRWTNEAGVGS